MAKYLVPQECGNKTGVRWAKITDNTGKGIQFTGDKIYFSALPYTPHELENAMHPYELPEIHYTVVRVAMQQMGVGLRCIQNICWMSANRWNLRLVSRVLYRVNIKI